MKRTKCVLGAAVVLCTSVLAVSFLTSMRTPLFMKMDASSDNVLEHGDIPNLDNTYKNGTFTSKTKLGNDIAWEYKYGKSSSGLIELGKNFIGNPGLDNFYIGNTSPITSLSSLTVNFSNGEYLYIYGSSDLENFYLVDTLSSSKDTSTRVAKYLYFRIVNGNQEDDPLTINSISFDYDCVISEYTDEVVDITSNNILMDNNSVLSLDNTSKMDGFRSSQSLKVSANADGNTGTWVISLGHSYTGAEFKKATLSYYLESMSNTDYDSNHKYSRFMIYPANNTSRISSSCYVQTSNFNNGQDWTIQSYPFSNVTGLSDSATVNSLYIKSVYVKDYLHLDQMHLSLGLEDLDPAIINTYEANDMISESLHVGYGTVTGVYDYITHSNNSVRSSKVRIDSDWRMWYYNDIGMGENLNNHTISYDMYCTDFTSGKTAAAISFKYLYDDARYTVNFSNSVNGLVITTLDNGWTHVEMDIDDIQDTQTGAGDTTDVSNLGWNVGYARTIYIDNLRVEAKDIPTEPTILLNGPEDKSIQGILPEEVRTYINDLHESRENVVNDYVLDVNEVNTTEGHPRIANYIASNKYYDYFAPITLTYRIYNYSTLSVYIHLSEDSNFTNEKVIETTSLKNYQLSNLKRNTTYYWKVVTSDELLSSETYSFTTEDTARFISTGDLHNVRDIGGYMTKSGKRIKQGLIYRGGELNQEDYYDSDSSHHYQSLDNDNINLLLNELEIRKEFDLRSENELPNISGSGLGNQVEYERVETYCPAYNGISKNTYNVNRLAPVFRSFLEANTKHVYFHCRGGADRTGTVGFILGGFLGMSFTDLCLEYELTSCSRNPRYRDIASDYGSFPEMIQQLYDNICEYDHSGNHDIQEICTNLLLTAGLTEQELNTLSSVMLED